MARPPRATGAGAAQRKRNIAQVRNEPRRIDPVAANVEVAMVTVCSATVDDPTVPERLCCRLPQPLNVVIVTRPALIAQAGRPPETDAQRARQGPRAQP